MSGHRGLTAVLIGLAAAGCGEAGPSLAPLAGTCTVDGRPLSAGLLQFLPEAAGTPAAVAVVEAGRFTAATAGRPGAVPGRYRIRVEARNPPRDETDTLPASLVAEKYSNAESSGLSCEVIAGRENLVEFQLEPPR